MTNRIRQVAAGLVVLGIVLGIGVWYAGQWYRSGLIEDERADISGLGDSTAAGLSSALNQRTALLSGLSGFVVAHLADHLPADRNSVEASVFQTFAARLRQGVPGIRRLEVSALIDTGLVHPAAAALLPGVAGDAVFAAERDDLLYELATAARAGQTGMFGPYSLIGGGSGLILSSPVDMRGSPWGSVRVVAELDSLLAEAGVLALPASVTVAIRSDQGRMVLGEPELFEQSPVLRPITVPGGTWTLALVPVRGWDAVIGSRLDAFHAATAAAALMALALTGMALTSRARLRAMVDTRTRALRKSEERFRTIAQTIPLPAAICARSDGSILFANAELGDLLGRPAEHLPGASITHYYEDPGLRAGLMARIAGDGAFDDCEVAMRRADGTPFCGLVSGRAVTVDGVDAAFSVFVDLTARKQLEERIRLQATAIETAANAMFITDVQGRIQWVNRAFMELSGFQEFEAVGRTPRILKSGSQTVSFYRSLWETLLRGEVWRNQMVNRHRDGHFYTVEQTVTPIRDLGGKITHFVAVHENISARVAAEQNMIHMAHHDGLTDLPNRMLFGRRVAQAVERTGRSGGHLAVMLLDLDNFKDVNDTLGHATGDALLVAAARRLETLMRRTDTLARLGGDEFAILVDRLSDVADAQAFAARVNAAFEEALNVDGHIIQVTTSIGIATFPGSVGTVEQLVRHADLAMYRAKRDGRNCWRHFDPEMDRQAREKVALERDLRNALDEGELWLAYQPQIDLRSGFIIGAEALLRWSHPERGLVSPADFIPVAEEAGLILAIGDWVIAEACRQMREWRSRGLPAVRVAVNLSAAQFEQENLIDRVVGHLNDNGLPPEALEIEITESVVMNRSHRVLRNLAGFQSTGIPVSIDDFGTGYSSLANLRFIPVSRVKIDRSFVAGIGRNSSDEAIVDAVIGLGHTLGLRVVAEGAETAEQVVILRNKGCDELQGFHISRPLPAVEFHDFVRGYRKAG